jgi:hypothetical protein
MSESTIVKKVRAELAALKAKFEADEARLFGGKSELVRLG